MAYIQNLASGEGDQAGWARSLQIDCRDLKTWLLLSILGDMLESLRRLNVSTQRTNLRILQVDTLVDSCKSELDDYMTPVINGVITYN